MLPKPKKGKKKPFLPNMKPGTATQQFQKRTVHADPLLQPCTFCQHSGADFQCSVCGALYCGVECQLRDWQDHRTYRCIPRLLKATPVYVAPEFWATSTNPSFSPARPVQAKFPTTHLEENVAQQAPQENVTARPAYGHTLPQRPVEICATRPAVEYSAQPIGQEYFAPQPAQQNFPIRAANVNMTPTQAIAKKPTHVVQKQQNSSPLVNFSIPPPVIKVPAQVGSRSSTPIAMPDDATTPKAAVPHLKESILSAILPNEQKTASQMEDSLVKRHIIENRLLPVQFPVAGRKVRITHIENDMIFFYGTGLEPNGTSNRYLSFMKRSLEAARETKQCLSAPPPRFAMVYAPYEGEYYRAAVNSIEGANAVVIFPDFGNTATVAWAELKEIKNPEIKYAPTLIFQAKVDNVKEFTKTQIDFLKRLVEIDEFLIIKVFNVPNMQLKVVDLRHTQELYTLSEKLLALQANEKLVKAVTKQTVSVAQADLTNPSPVASPPVREEEACEPIGEVIPASATGAETGEQNEKVTSVVVTDEMERLQVEELLALVKNPASIPKAENQKTPNQDTYAPVSPKEFQTCSLNPGQQESDVQLVIVNSTKLDESNTISVMPYLAAARLDQVKKESNHFGMRDPHPYLLKDRQNEACLIKCDGAWCRAFKSGVECQTFFLLDEGCDYTGNVSESDVRRYPAKLCRDIFVTECIVDNPRMIKLIMGGDEKKNGLEGLSVTADVFIKDEDTHIRIIDILLE